MLRFGRIPKISYIKWLKQYVYRQQLQARRRALFIPLNTSYPAEKFALHIPNHWNMFVLRSKKTLEDSKLIYLSSEVYFFKIPYVSSFMLFDYDNYTNGIAIRLTKKTYCTSLYLKKLQKLMYMFSQVQFVRMKFRGKGYYIYKTLRNTIAPNFGYAHRVYVYAYFVSLKFLKKTSIIMFGLLKTDLIKVGYRFKTTRPMNIFTGRGVRFTRQLVYKKTGKISSYR
jgi:hypothetical protein